MLMLRRPVLMTLWRRRLMSVHRPSARKLSPSRSATSLKVVRSPLRTACKQAHAAHGSEQTRHAELKKAELKKVKLVLGSRPRARLQRGACIRGPPPFAPLHPETALSQIKGGAQNKLRVHAGAVRVQVRILV